MFILSIYLFITTKRVVDISQFPTYETTVCIYIYICVCVIFMKASALYNISNLYLLTFYFIFLLNRYVSALSEEAGQANLQSAVSSGWSASLHLIGKV